MADDKNNMANQSGYTAQAKQEAHHQKSNAGMTDKERQSMKKREDNISNKERQSMAEGKTNEVYSKPKKSEKLGHTNENIKDRR